MAVEWVVKIVVERGFIGVVLVTVSMLLGLFGIVGWAIDRIGE